MDPRIPRIPKDPFSGRLSVSRRFERNPSDGRTPVDKDNPTGFVLSVHLHRG